MTKKEFSYHVSTNWFLYLVAFIASLFIATYSISLASKPKAFEKVSIFITSYSSTSDLDDFFTSIKDDYLREVEISNHSATDDYYEIYLSIVDDLDILIIPEEYIDYVKVDEYISFDDENIKLITDKALEYYTVDNVNYGIKIHSKNEEGGIFSDYLTYSSVYYEDEVYDDNYYLFISKDSMHMGELNNSEYSGGLNILKEIFKHEDEESE